MGMISDPIVQEQNMQITSFKHAAGQMLSSLRQFKKHLDLMEGEFGVANQQNNNLNKMLAQYEQTLNNQFGGQVAANKKDVTEDNSDGSPANLDESSIYDQL